MENEILRWVEGNAWGIGAGIIVLGTIWLFLGSSIKGEISDMRAAGKVAPHLFASRENMEHAGLSPDCRNLAPTSVLHHANALKDWEEYNRK
jgi:hypothetical protein